VLDDRMYQLIGARRADASARVDLLTKLLLARNAEDGGGDAMSDEQARDEAATLFVAGHETTANALAWSFYLMARHPDVRAKVQAEADAFEFDPTQPLDPQRLEYTTRVFKEALRLYPPIPMLPRRCKEPTHWAGAEIHTQTLVFANVYGLHYNASVWPDPERFDPERFTEQNEKLRHRSAWLPFGVGPRVCVGASFALLEGPIVIATLMKRAQFEIDSAKTITPEAFATLRPKGGLPAIVKLRRN
jgi:cytochrome P450